ncbi:SDR family oxidoreductase [Hoeflea sp. CAU 1731]
MSLEGKKILIVGGSSGIGFGVAEASLAAGGNVAIASRSSEKLEKAASRLGGGASARVLDTADQPAVEAFFANSEPYDHVVVSAAETRIAAVSELPLDDAYRSMESKFWGAYRVARQARIIDGGSLTLISGTLSTRPKRGAALQSAINAALEGLTRGLALEMAPVRVNCVSPGLVMTEMYDRLEGDARKSIFEGAAERMPVGQIGAPAHIALQVVACMANSYMTGATIMVDGGGAIA